VWVPLMTLLPFEKRRIALAIGAIVLVMASAGCVLFSIPWWAALGASVIAMVIVGYLSG
jgi:hypothetical protein